MGDVRHSLGHGAGCGCCGGGHGDGLNRRDFLAEVGVAALGGAVLTAMAPRPPSAEPSLPRREDRPLRMQPVLLHSVPKRREATSWRQWGGLQTEADAEAEKARIERELKSVRQRADFALELLPVKAATTQEQAAAIAAEAHDGAIVYAAGCGEPVLRAATAPEKWNLIFCRHRTGPAYLWYEIVHPRYLRKMVDEYGQPGMTTDDVVVDELDDIVWRLRALHGLKNTVGKKIVTIGGAGGWGAGGKTAPQRAQELWKLQYIDVPYPQLAERIQKAFADGALVGRCRGEASRYLKQGVTRVDTKREFIDRAFVLAEVFRQILADAGTDAITVQHCMGTIMGASQTTACLPLSLLNDEGYMAFCESDFVVIPSGILLRGISGRPVFLNDPTYPHHGLVTLAHCTAPRRMDGCHCERAKLLTHFESDYGAAPKVEMRLGQTLTNLVPDFASAQWVGFEGKIVGNPFLDICRSQIDVEIQGDWKRLLAEMKGFHWMTCYGNYLRETGYALGKVGVGWLDVSAA
ncbi:MAG: twin-arginine translocation signal domain-containing protein [Verrucomicrobiae bacterium]|nr:twin-arginine translocation signal domain-containing protein [Verrucomicrobiae bacterium]